MYGSSCIVLNQQEQTTKQEENERITYIGNVWPYCLNGFFLKSNTLS